nr:MAG: RNA-binding protein [Bacillota bacterium]
MQVAAEVPIRTPYITLGDLLKLVRAVPTGGRAKQVIQAGQVRVNGEVETRRGRKLVPGDRVTWEGHGEWVVTAAPAARGNG